jgi:integrase
MLTGWVRQQQTRFLSEQGTIKPRVALVRRLAEFTNAYPWEWTPSDVEAFFSQLRSSSGRKPIEMSTGRGYTQTPSVFMEYITDRRYGWPEECLERFGQFPQQILHEDNTVVHASEYEGKPGRRPLTYDEVQSLFDALDTKVDTARASGRKGALTALRDAALLKMIYAFGLRRNEARMLDLADLRRAQKSPQYRQYGGLFVRYGKASKGSPPKRRTVLTVPEMDWIVGVLDQWVTDIRPLFSPGSHPALFVTGV